MTVFVKVKANQMLMYRFGHFIHFAEVHGAKLVAFNHPSPSPLRSNSDELSCTKFLLGGHWTVSMGFRRLCYVQGWEKDKRSRMS